MEFLEHKSGDTAEKWLRNSGKVGPVIGAALGALNAAEIITYDIYSTYEIECTYSDFQKLGTIFSFVGFRQTGIDYTDVVRISGSVQRDVGDALVDKLVQATAGRAIIKKTGEKYDF